MRKKKRRGFTLVELLVVIAILAILATVSILGYTSFTKKANISNDEALVSQMNLILQTNEQIDDTKAHTMQQAIEQMLENGFIYENLSPSTAGYHIVYDVVNNRFALLTDKFETQFKDKLSDNHLNIFVVVKEADDIKEGYSLYLDPEFDTENHTIAVSTGIDAGKNTNIKVINYIYDDGKVQDVVIRTNGGTLTINHTNNDSHQIHYGTASSVTVSTGTSCYECHAVVKEMTISQGKAIADEGGVVGVVNAAENVVLEEANGGVFIIPENATAANINEDVAATIGYTKEDNKYVASTDRTAKAEVAKETIKKASGSGDNDTQTECNHDWICKANNDGTHNVVCSKCNEVQTENVVCTYCTDDSKDNYNFCDCGYTRYLTFTAKENSTIGFSTYDGTFQYKKADNEWSSSVDTVDGISLNVGEKIYFRGTNCIIVEEDSGDHSFTIIGNVEVSGDVTSLINNVGNVEAISDMHCFDGMFYNCTGLTSAKNLILPSTTLIGSDYAAMFYGCTNLTEAPKLPAMTVPQWCYYQMFYGCTSLTKAPELPATTVRLAGYYQMFYGCTSLTEAPSELPAQTLYQKSYLQMFEGCINLKKVPDMSHITSLDTNANQACKEMFSGCISLKISTNSQDGTKFFTCLSYTATANLYDVFKDMFKDTGGTFTGTPSAGTTYYWYE